MHVWGRISLTGGVREVYPRTLTFSFVQGVNGFLPIIDSYEQRIKTTSPPMQIFDRCVLVTNGVVSTILWARPAHEICLSLSQTHSNLFAKSWQDVCKMFANFLRTVCEQFVNRSRTVREKFTNCLRTVREKFVIGPQAAREQFANILRTVRE